MTINDKDNDLNDLFLLKSNTYDDHAQCTRDVVVRGKQEVEQLLAKYRSCNHMFVILSKRGWHQSAIFHILDNPVLIECVHCGLTNKFMLIEDTENGYPDARIHEREEFGIKVRSRGYTTEEFVKQFGWDGNNEYLDGQRYLSHDTIPSYHSGILFRIARTIYFSVRDKIDTGESEGMEDAIFAIMKELHEMETPLERLKISSLVHASALIERYKHRHKLYSTS